LDRKGGRRLIADSSSENFGAETGGAEGVAREETKKKKEKNGVSRRPWISVAVGPRM